MKSLGAGFGVSICVVLETRGLGGGEWGKRDSPLEVVAEGGDVFSGVFADEQHLPHVGLGLRVAFEAVFVAGLFLADLAVLVGRGGLVRSCSWGWG